MKMIKHTKSLKLLSVAALIGSVAFGTPAMADVNNSQPELVSGTLTNFAGDSDPTSKSKISVLDIKENRSY